MRLNRSLSVAAFLGAASMATQTFAQDAVPTPPPAGVPAKGPRVVPMPVAPMGDEHPLPKIPDNPIKLEKNVPPAVEAAPMPEQMSAVAPPVVRRPVKPIGPVYYFGPNLVVDNVTTPPAMHLPNSPFVEDLSVAGDHGRYTYYSYRRPWYTPGQQSANVTIVW